MTQDEIIKIFKTRKYRVLSISNVNSFVAIAPEEKLYLIAIVPFESNFLNKLKASVNQLIKLNMSFINIISETLEDVEIDLSLIIICDQMVNVTSQIEQWLYMHRIQLILYDGSARSITKEIPKLRKLTDTTAINNFRAFHDYVKEIIRYFEKTPDSWLPLGFVNDKFDIKKDDNDENEGNDPIVIIKKFTSPRQLASEVKKYVIGQNDVIDSIAIPFFQHYESMINGTTCDTKVSFIIVGSTGTGKSEILRRFAHVCGVPIIRINTSDCNPNAWTGIHISDHIASFINKESDIEKFKYAIIIFNEFDKITHHDNTYVSKNGSDWDADMQREFLRFYDKGYELLIQKTQGLEKFRFPTDNLLLCYDGAYSGIEKIIEKRLNIHNRIGFTTQGLTSKTSNILSNLIMEDLENWGYSKELLGRISSFFVMNPMTEDLIYEIFSNASENIIDSHINQCKQYGINLSFTEEALRLIAKKTFELGKGFRPAKSILFKVMKEIYYDCDKHSGKEFIIDKIFVENRLAITA